VPGANSTCWGDGETAVAVVETQEHTHILSAKDSPSIPAVPPPIALLTVPRAPRQKARGQARPRTATGGGEGVKGGLV